MCGTVRMQPGERSTSDPMFIRVSPLFVYLHSQYFHIWHFESPVVKRSASLKIPSILLPFSSRTHLKTMHSQCASAFRPHVYQGFPYVYIYYTVSSTICTYLVARYKYSQLVIGSAQYFGATFIAELPKSQALTKCIGILAPCLLGFPLYVYTIHSVHYHLYIFSRPL